MIIISKNEYEKIDSDYRGIFHDYYGDHPEWKGRRVVMSTCITHNSNESCKLWIEGIDFMIKEENE